MRGKKKIAYVKNGDKRMAGKANGATIAQVAQDVGLSLTTVSRAINHPEKVNPKTLTIIQESFERLSYDLDRRNARAFLNQKPSRTIMFVCNNINDNLISKIVEGAGSICSRKGYDLLLKIIPANDRGFHNLLDSIASLRPAGLLLMAKLTHEHITKLNDLLPCVQCCEYDGNKICSSVSVDFNVATRNIIYHILGLGRKRIGFLALRDNPLYIAQQRRTCYRDVVMTEGLEHDDDWEIRLESVDFTLAVSAATRVLQSEHRPDAFLTSSDVFAAAVIKAAHLAGLRVPQDLVVCGFDDLEISKAMTPSITTIDVPGYQMGYLAGEMLSSRLQSGRKECQNIYLQTELIVRESSTLSNGLGYE